MAHSVQLRMHSPRASRRAGVVLRTKRLPGRKGLASGEGPHLCSSSYVAQRSGGACYWFGKGDRACHCASLCCRGGGGVFVCALGGGAGFCYGADRQDWGCGLCGGGPDQGRGLYAGGCGGAAGGRLNSPRLSLRSNFHRGGLCLPGWGYARVGSSATCSRLPFAAPNRRAGGADVALRSLGAACLCLSSVAGFDLPLYPRVSAIHSFISTYSLLLTNVQIWRIISRVISKKSLL